MSKPTNIPNQFSDVLALEEILDQTSRFPDEILLTCHLRTCQPGYVT
ncbi:MAG: hypothetical protein AAGF74_03035 [Pseudomonadota bacterium]